MFNICQGGCVELVTNILAYREGVGTSEHGLEYELAIRDVWSAAEQYYLELWNIYVVVF
jgi:hypothetical protein